MPCFHPLDAFQASMPNSEGKRPIFFKENSDCKKIKLPCGQCVGCRLERSRQWAVRCMHEAQMHKDNCFITLTFSPEELEKRDNPMSLDVRDFQLFMKRLRKKYKQKIRFYHCGEYGEKNGRPHYHACLFGFDFPDKTFWKNCNGNNLYISKSLSDLWPFGFSTIGDVTFESAAYVARYIMKKINEGHDIDSHMKWAQKYVDWTTGELLEQEYTTMSRRPGVGQGWVRKYIDDVYPHDYVVVRGVKCKPPRYYDAILHNTRPYEFDDIKENRLTTSKIHADNNTPDRLAMRETVTKARLKLLPRNVE